MDDVTSGTQRKKKKNSPVTKTHQEISKLEQTFKCHPYRSVTFNELLPTWMDLCSPVLSFSVSCGKRSRLLNHGNTSDDWSQIPTSKQINLVWVPVRVLIEGRAEIQRQREACVKMGKNHSHRVSKHPLKGVSCSNIAVFAYKSGMRVFQILLIAVGK